MKNKVPLKIKEVQYKSSAKVLNEELDRMALDVAQIVRANGSGAFPAPKPQKKKRVFSLFEKSL